MMTRHLPLILALLSLLVLSGCASSGFFFKSTKAPTDHLLQTEGHELGDKQGEACMQSILGLAAFGDSSVSTAAKNGGVTQVGSVDESTFRVLFFYTKTCTIVTGT